MGKPLDLTGMVFGSLTAIEPTDKRKNGLIVWHFKCACGNDYYTTAN